MADKELELRIIVDFLRYKYTKEGFPIVNESMLIEEANLYLFSKSAKFKPCGEGDNICNCKNESECGYK